MINILSQADVEQDQAKRVQEYTQAQQLAADMVLTVPLYYVPEFVVYRSNIKGSSSFASPETLNIGPNVEFNYATITKTP